MCKKVVSRKICKYGIHCWFKHKEHEELEITNNETLENKNIDKNEVIEKLLDKIEKMSERITQLEQANQNQTLNKKICQTENSLEKNNRIEKLESKGQQ